MDFRKRYPAELILDLLLRGTVDDCLRCGEFRRIMGRGLCKSCYLTPTIRSAYPRCWTNLRVDLFSSIEDQRRRFEELCQGPYENGPSRDKELYLGILERRLWPSQTVAPAPQTAAKPSSGSA